eukprot:CAMPEP_0170583212 /NCGR_PEP_ID=MMETSP0224-20130122/8006_1 /TAXON_ID=285029 /ORGANISM="Togula jolla, Strain CCCM 725" /LENGTH=846 /DNA_ID=CAMNT_0010906507 /DNA_START=1 /DNA_END=2541 /DNA_ORIENTATION=-
MRTHSTPVKSAGHAGDGLASMRTHSTPVKSAGHAGDGLASMRTHSTPVKSAGHAGDGLASMRTHSTPVKSAGHAGDGLASMRTHSTPVKSAGHAGDGLASMRTHSTPVKSAGHPGEGLASKRVQSSEIKLSGGTVSDRRSLVTAVSGNDSHDSHAAYAALVKEAGNAGEGHVDSFTYEETEATASKLALEVNGPAADKDVGEYWLPWHIDSNFVTLIHKEMYAYESDGSLAPEPDGAGVAFMNQDGDVVKYRGRDDAMILQFGAFAQIYAGGQLAACRHAVLTPMAERIARFNYCNFWYVPWNTVCEPPAGLERAAINSGWNAMMDESYLNITMKQGFAAFRQFMTAPEARVQFANSASFRELATLIPMPARYSLDKAASQAPLVIDVLTDVRCPFSYLAKKGLEQAIKNLGLSGVTMRYHPIFLNPNVTREGESLDDYLLREYGFSKEYAHSEDYPLHKAGRELGVNFNPNRRVVNTFDAFCLIAMAQEENLQDVLVEELSRRYFEDGLDISDEEVLCRAAEAVGLSGGVRERLRDPELRSRVQATYEVLSASVGSVPHFLVRERLSGSGIDAGGMRPVEEWEELLRTSLAKGQHMGMSIPGPLGSKVWLPEANPTSPVSLAFAAQHGKSSPEWPFTADDFAREDETEDSAMYAAPRLVNHLDEDSLASIREAYRAIFRQLPPNCRLLDLCSSWTSNYPVDMMADAHVTVHGLNEEELRHNQLAAERHVQDLNAQPRLPWADRSFDAVTLALSVQYLTKPQAVFSEIHRVLAPGGIAVVVYSHRCFLEKTIKVWARELYDGEGHAHILRNYFEHSPHGGWSGHSSIDVSPLHGDPVWMVTAVKDP